MEVIKMRANVGVMKRSSKQRRRRYTLEYKVKKSLPLSEREVKRVKEKIEKLDKELRVLKMCL
jgi:hypothetical protein